LVAITEQSANLFRAKSRLIAALRAAETERSSGQKRRGTECHSRQEFLLTHASAASFSRHRISCQQSWRARAAFTFVFY